jgi:uncharacterized protein
LRGVQPQIPQVSFEPGASVKLDEPQDGQGNAMAVYLPPGRAAAFSDGGAPARTPNLCAMTTARTIRALALTAAAAVVFSAAAIAASFSPPPTPDHYVVDPAGAIADNTTADLESELRAFEKATGHQVIVYIGETTGDVPLETYTAETAHTWRIGRKGKDDGAILFLFMKDHKVRIEVGYGLEGSLTDATASGIIQNEIVPRMREDDTDAAVTAGVAKMLAAIDPSFTPTATAAPEESGEVTGNISGNWFVAIFLAIFCIPWIFVIFRIIYAARHGQLIRSTGSSSGHGSGGGSWFSSSSSSDDDSSSGDDDFDAGGGDFGGGGASGSW